MIEIDGILYDADDYYYWEHLQACLTEMEIDNDQNRVLGMDEDLPC